MKTITNHPAAVPGTAYVTQISNAPVAEQTVHATCHSSSDATVIHDLAHDFAVYVSLSIARQGQVIHLQLVDEAGTRVRQLTKVVCKFEPALRTVSPRRPARKIKKCKKPR